MEKQHFLLISCCRIPPWNCWNGGFWNGQRRNLDISSLVYPSILGFSPLTITLVSFGVKGDSKQPDPALGLRSHGCPIPGIRQGQVG